MKSFKEFLKGTKGNWAPYEVWHHRDEDNRLNFYVSHAGHHVGYAKLSGDEKRIADVHVREDHRRKGVTSALYNHIEKHLGYSLEPTPIQTPAGQAFWKGRKK